MHMRVGRSDKVLEDTPALLTARRNDGPYAFAPTTTSLAAGALRDALIDNQGANRLLGEVVRRFYTGDGEKGEVAVRSFSSEPLCERVCLHARRRMPNNAHEFLPNTMCASQIGRISESFSTVDGLEKSPHARKEFTSPAGQHLVRLLDEKPDFANQMRHAKLDGDRCVAHELAVCREEVAADHSAERFRENVPQDIGSTRGIDMEQGEVVGPETPCPQILARLRMARLVHAKTRLRGKRLAKFRIGLLKCGGDSLNHLGQCAGAHRELEYFLEELLDAGKGNVAFRFQERDRGRKLRSYEPASTNLDRHRRIHDTAGTAVQVLACAVLGHEQRRVDQVRLLNYGPLTEWSQTSGFFSSQFVRLDAVDALGWKRGSFMPRVPRLATGASFVPLPGHAERRRLDDVRRRRLRTRARVACQACDLCLERRDLRLHGDQFRRQIRDRFFQERILALQLLNPNVLVVHGARYTTRRCGSLAISRNSRKP